MLKVVTHAGHQAREYWLQHRGGKFEGKSRLAAETVPDGAIDWHTVDFAEAET
jgi:hypothetical protein